MTPQTRALIEAAEEILAEMNRIGFWPTPIARFRSAISSAKAAEEGVDTKIAILERCVWNMEHDAYHCNCGSMDTEVGAYMKVAEVEVREKEGL